LDEKGEMLPLCKKIDTLLAIAIPEAVEYTLALAFCIPQMLESHRSKMSPTKGKAFMVKMKHFDQ
jgi:hypothetical protein